MGEPNEDVGQLALCAFRYSLTRSAGVPREICERILRVADQVPQSWREQIAKEAHAWAVWVSDPDDRDRQSVRDMALTLMEGARHD